LVDPDNRRTVDFARRAQALADDRSWAELLQDWHEGAPKMRLLARLLQLRREHPALFLDGELKALSDPASADLVFVREHAGQVLLVAVRRATVRRCPGPALAWKEDAGQQLNAVPQRKMRNVLDDRTEVFKGSASDALLFSGSPVAVWISQESGADGQQ